MWLRLPREREMVLLWKPNDSPTTQWRRYTAYRMPGAPGTQSMVSFMVVHALHSIADGQSYEPIVGDITAVYGALRKAGGSTNSTLSVPVPAVRDNGLEELQRRLMACLGAVDFAASPHQCSLRGGMWRFRKRGYGHMIGLQRGAISALKIVARMYGAPLDALLLALSVVGIARASDLDTVELTLYVPLRDSPGEASSVGLFADWRDVTIRVDKTTGTVLGVVLDVAHLLRNRQWGVYNAIRKPEATVVNFQPLDAAPPGGRSGFVQVGEELWRIGECLRPESRGTKIENIHQPLSLTIEQQDGDSWWILISASYDLHPPVWMRRFVRGFEDAFWALLTSPTKQVHGEVQTVY